MQTDKSRIYAIDRLRVAMMFLVVFCHSILTYTVTNFGDSWPIKDPHKTNVLFDILLIFSQSLSMSILFVVSGYFSAMLFIESGPKKMLLNRLKRITLPFVLGLTILYPIVFIAFVNFTLNAGTNIGLLPTTIYGFIALAWSKLNTMHLWFLYLLSFYCVGSWAISLVCKKVIPTIYYKKNIAFNTILQLKMAPVLFAIITFILLCVQRTVFVNSYTGLSLFRWEFLQYAFIFGFGWLLYSQKNNNLDRFKQNYIFFAITGAILFVIHLGMFSTTSNIEKTSGLYVFAAIKALSIWFLIFGIMGLFIKHFNTYSPATRYISDASYWIYLIHLPIVVYFQTLLIPVSINPFFKCAVVYLGTFIVAIITYHFMVRNTFVGVFLNGKKYQTGLFNRKQVTKRG